MATFFPSPSSQSTQTKRDPSETHCWQCSEAGDLSPKKKIYFVVTFYRRAVPFRVGKYAQTVRHRIPRRMGIILALAGTDFTRNLDTFLRTARDRTSAFCVKHKILSTRRVERRRRGSKNSLFFNSAMLENPEPRTLFSTCRPSTVCSVSRTEMAKMVDGELSALAALFVARHSLTRRHRLLACTPAPEHSSGSGGGAQDLDRLNINTRKKKNEAHTHNLIPPAAKK